MSKRNTVFFTVALSKPLKSALVAYSEATGLKLKAAVGQLLTDALAARGVTVTPIPDPAPVVKAERKEKHE